MKKIYIIPSIKIAKAQLSVGVLDVSNKGTDIIDAKQRGGFYDDEEEDSESDMWSDKW